MAAPSIDELMLLDVRSRIELISRLWDSLIDEDVAPPLSVSDRQLIEERLADHKANPSDVVSWDELKAQLAKK
jgi:putative addiction module component (TIGR02574 family)